MDPKTRLISLKYISFANPNDLQSERDNYVRSTFKSPVRVYHPWEEVTYEPIDVEKEFSAFMESRCKPLKVSISLEAINRDTATFYSDLNMSTKLILVKQVNLHMSRVVGIVEPYAFTLSHLIVYANSVPLGNPKIDEPAVFHCCRYLGKQYTVMVKSILDFNNRFVVASPRLVELLQLYLKILLEKYENIEPVW